VLWASIVSLRTRGRPDKVVQPVRTHAIQGLSIINTLTVSCVHHSESPFDTLLGAMNTKLSVAYMVNLMARLSTRMVDPDPRVTETMFHMWLTDSVAASHTDMLCLARGSEPILWLYAPFQSRPLGKPLPSIMSTCSCPDRSAAEPVTLRRAKSRKEWEVDHNGADGMALHDVVVKATCTVCRQMWPLPSEHLAGTLRKHAGSFAAVVQYFAPVSP
jgi:hypothetical protein